MLQLPQAGGRIGHGSGQGEVPFSGSFSLGMAGTNAHTTSLENTGLGPAMIPARILPCWRKGLEHVGRVISSQGLWKSGAGREGSRNQEISKADLPPSCRIVRGPEMLAS